MPLHNFLSRMTPPNNTETLETSSLSLYRHSYQIHTHKRKHEHTDTDIHMQTHSQSQVVGSDTFNRKSAELKRNLGRPHRFFSLPVQLSQRCRPGAQLCPCFARPCLIFTPRQKARGSPQYVRSSAWPTLIVSPTCCSVWKGQCDCVHMSFPDDTVSLSVSLYVRARKMETIKRVEKEKKKNGGKNTKFEMTTVPTQRWRS